MEYFAIITRGFLRAAGALDELLVITRGYLAGTPANLLRRRTIYLRAGSRSSKNWNPQTDPRT